ncbi:hypothetical protein PR202_gb13686 [Eleusine coracana subsp. coracana]|uniref:Phosphoribosylaminoimidazole-succinocarboxamide synthase, chloroplastic n=1 Tax=Eleusine coracana subsp. coracana TaxID=191504 RepID=A0AAV5ETN3_ELECO|nr:hypothetical protein PR202_gb13686 [Eleusine coracana subsp. coracana]
MSSSSSSPPRAPPLTAAGGGTTTSLLAADPGHRDAVLLAARAAMGNCLGETRLDLDVPGLRLAAKGKVRDVYESGEHLVLVTTDRQSAFDRVLASIPFKGQVCSYLAVNFSTSADEHKTRHITPNAVVSSPDKNVTIAKRCSVFPVEFVVRGYVTGSTDTSLWTVYNKGLRNYCGNALPNGMVKNQRLSTNILTPTTKAVDHDVPIISSGLMSKEDFDEARSKALSLFKYGQEVALENGLILVDTKYEFGKADDGTIMLIDEVHTPDSSRYWIASSYEERFKSGLEPENVDKVLPDAPEDLVCELAWRYIFLFETITNSKFEIPETQEPIQERISRNVAEALHRLC